MSQKINYLIDNPTKISDVNDPVQTEEFIDRLQKALTGEITPSYRHLKKKSYVLLENA